VAIIYFWNAPVCRKCAQLVYSCQGEGEMDRSWRRTQMIDKKLAAAAVGVHPQRPKHMKRKKYRELLDARWDEEMFRDAGMVAALAGLRSLR
jgi:hypothetical protein